MRDLPTPTLGLTQLLPPFDMTAHRQEAALLRTLPSPLAMQREGMSIRTEWARHQDQVREAQALRHQVFVNEMGARIDTPLAGHDVDEFDDHCEHLLVRDLLTDDVVGTYRVLMPDAAKRVGRWYTDTEFDLSECRLERSSTVELGRSCVHASHRTGAAIFALWSELAGFMSRHRLQTMIGCASIPMQSAGEAFALGPAMAASIYRSLGLHLVDAGERARPLCALPIDQLDDSLDVLPPALIKAYLRLGANILGAPAWDPDFNTADLPMRMRLSDLPTRYRRHFLA